ncbi:MAG: patatin-like phospholipase family protein [Anaerolineae bacterium]
MKRKPQIGLALSGGGVRGLAHIGVLEFLEEEQIPIAYLAGTSMGGIVAGLYAAGVPIEKLKQISATMGVLDFATPDPNRYGLLGHKKMQAFFAETLGSADVTFADLAIPTTLIAVDLESGEMVHLNEGPLIPAMLATSAVPLIFGPVRHKDRWLIDGGTINNFPFDVVRTMGADRVLGVHTPMHIQLSLQPHATRRRLSFNALFSSNTRLLDWKTPFLIAESSIHHTISLIHRQRMTLSPPDLVLSISLPNVGTFTADRNIEIVQAGHATAQAHRDKIHKLYESPLPPPWRQRFRELGLRLRRAWQAFRSPPYKPFP